MLFYAAFNSISVISRRQFTLFMSFLGFSSTKLGLWSVLPKDTSTKQPRGSSAARTQNPRITSQTLYHWATQDPDKQTEKQTDRAKKYMFMYIPFDLSQKILDFIYDLINSKWFLTLPKQALVFMCLQNKSFENTVGKGEIARNEQFLLFPVFSTLLENYLPFLSNLILSSANSSNLEYSRICRLGKG